MIDLQFLDEGAGSLKVNSVLDVYGVVSGHFFGGAVEGESEEERRM